MEKIILHRKYLQWFCDLTKYPISHSIHVMIIELDYPLFFVSPVVPNLTEYTVGFGADIELSIVDFIVDRAGNVRSLIRNNVGLFVF